MKKIITLLLLISVGFVNAQAYKGKGDIKAQVGANIQDGATGIQVSTDFGLGENMSYGFTACYLLSVQEYEILGVTQKPEFGDRFDLKARFSANIGNVLKLNPKMDIYPGLNLGLRNFGAHLGFRYFLTDGFGLYAEAGIPIAKYDTKITGFDNYNNQFTLNVGVSFNL
ncbi:DUF6646 family protein [Flavobacterium luteum]|uniref:Porin family protein n=1 Tax=Flavobacterium luteum TaxID=2026654 RepID=A0A7J5AEI8_9FLAO|nr:DUF6646 family protein [Flavobacterium luteum]KAB1155994.1 hypothetical protein F6464_07270 [Flavobacterium luteum]